MDPPQLGHVTQQITLAQYPQTPGGVARHGYTQPAPRYGDIVYAALGDSISIDEYAGGPGRGAASLLARNHDEDFPHWRGRDLATRYPALDYHLLAVDGGTTGTLLNSQLPRLGASGLRPAVVTLTVGGNDLLAAYGDTPQARAVVRTVIVRVGQALTRLARLMRSPDDPIILGTVYDPSDGSADAARLGLPPWPDVGDVLTELNDGLRAVTAQHRACIAEIHDRFLGHGLTVGDPAQSNPRPQNRALWYCNVIEPNAWGASAVRASFWQALQQSADHAASRSA
jgi:lysophospholipase L1-like esterase